MRKWISSSRRRRALLSAGMLIGVLVALTAAVVAFGTDLSRRTLIVFLLNAMLVLGLQVFIGDTGIVSFGHVAFMGVGAYLTALLTIPPGVKALQVPHLVGFLAHAHLGLIPAVAVSALVTALLAAVLGGGLIRMQEGAMAMATLALLVIAYALFQNWESVTRGTLGLFGIPADTTAWVALLGSAAFVLVARLYKDSRPGLRVRATREDPLAAQALGTNVVRVRYEAWILSASMMGAAGSLWALSVLAFDPNQFFFATTFSLLAMLVVGGKTSVTGAVLGAAVVTFLQDTLSRVEQGVRIGSIELPRLTGTVNFVIALLIIVSLISRPEGVMGRREIEDLLRRFRRSAPQGAGYQHVALGRVEAPTDAGAVLSAEEIDKRFQGLIALSRVSLTVAPGEILGLIGPNGSGKTTLLNVVSGILAPEGGRVRLNGRDVTSLPSHQVATLGLARTFQNIRLFSHLTVRENVSAVIDDDDPAVVTRVLGWLQLDDVADEEATSLPYGAQRRLEIARAVVRRPRVLLLDEPAAGMNETESDALVRTIRQIRDELGCGLVVIDHDLRLIMQLCERIQVLDQGRTIAVGSPQEVANDPAVIEAYIGGGEARVAEPGGQAPSA
jgi:branched-chain amino acid transport system permease protein